MGVLAVDLDLVGNDKVRRNALNVVADGLAVSGLLAGELVAWKEQDAQALCVIARVQLLELLVIGGSEAALGGHVDDEHGMAVKELPEIERAAPVKGVDGEFVNGLDGGGRLKHEWRGQHARHTIAKP